MNRLSFETYTKTPLAPTRQPGDVVILDNLPAHKSERQKRSSRHETPSSCSYRPTAPILIQSRWSLPNARPHLRFANTRTIDVLWQAIGSIFNLILQTDAPTISNMLDMLQIKYPKL